MNDTWSHAAARTLVRPLVGTRVTPNHLTTLRLVTGAAACVLLAVGGGGAELWSGILWLLSVFLDRADGELARVAKLQTRRGHLYDYYTDIVLNSSFFLCAGINLRHSALAGWAVPSGVVAWFSMLACCWLAEAYETHSPNPDERVWEGGWGFQPDDALYLLPCFVWLHWLAPVLIAAAVVASIIAVVFSARYIHLKRRLARSMAPLTADQIADYARRGWIVAPGFFSAAEAEEISGWICELERRPERAGVEMVYQEAKLSDPTVRLIQRIENICPFHEKFDRLAHGRLKAAVEALLGAPAVLFKDKINFKMAGGAGFEPHQDQQAGWSAYAPLFITALVCIDPATPQNGCLEIAQGARFTGLIGEEWQPLTPEQMAGFSMIAVPCNPGDVLFFDSYLPHASKANRTGSPRRILYLTYNAASHGDHRARYFADKRANFPPDVERKPGAVYRFRV